MGRLFDAVASIAGVRHRISYEAQAAMELEAVAEHGDADPARPRWSFTVGDEGVIDPEPVLRGAVAMVLAGDDPADVALELHHAIARAVADSVRRAVGIAGHRPVALTGGVFQNALLTGLTVAALRDDGHEVLTHRLVPANDGGLSLGQAVIAGVTRQAVRQRRR
jgi:hydrogenase maturation protein HypF